MILSIEKFFAYLTQGLIELVPFEDTKSVSNDQLISETEVLDFLLANPSKYPESWKINPGNTYSSYMTIVFKVSGVYLAPYFGLTYERPGGYYYPSIISNTETGELTSQRLHYSDCMPTISNFKTPPNSYVPVLKK
jgi:hypothetical protein